MQFYEPSHYGDGMVLHYWFLAPVGLAIAFVTISAGVSAAALWVPVYLLWLGLDPALAFWLTLFTVLFGFGSGSWRNLRDGTYNAAVVRGYAARGVPAAIVGALLAPLLPGRFLVALFGVFLVLYGAMLLWRSIRHHDGSFLPAAPLYELGLLEGLLTGLIALGAGVFTLPRIFRDRAIRAPSDAVGSAVIIIFVTSVTAALLRMRLDFVRELHRQLPMVGAMMIWALPSVVAGGQLAPRFARSIRSERAARLYMSVLIAATGVLTLVRAALNPG